MKTLLRQIEDARQEMIELASCFGLRDSRVLNKSCELDKLLNQYNRLSERTDGFKLRKMPYARLGEVFRIKACEG